METSDSDAAAATADRPTATLGRGVAFLELRAGQCHYPLGGPTDPPLRFCGEAAEPGSTYCPECRGIAYRRQDQRAVRLAAWVDRKA